MSLPTTDAERKAIPVWDGVVMYFPDALLAIAKVSKAGNDQHNPGQPLHWARGKSMDQFNTCMRHMMDHGSGLRYDSDSQRHLAKAAWRILAALQLDIENERRTQPGVCGAASGDSHGSEEAGGAEQSPLPAGKTWDCAQR